MKAVWWLCAEDSRPRGSADLMTSSFVASFSQHPIMLAISCKVFEWKRLASNPFFCSSPSFSWGPKLHAKKVMGTFLIALGRLDPQKIFFRSQKINFLVRWMLSGFAFKRGNILAFLCIYIFCGGGASYFCSLFRLLDMHSFTVIVQHRHSTFPSSFFSIFCLCYIAFSKNDFMLLIVWNVTVMSYNFIVPW